MNATKQSSFCKPSDDFTRMVLSDFQRQTLIVKLEGHLKKLGFAAVLGTVIFLIDTTISNVTSSGQICFAFVILLIYMLAFKMDSDLRLAKTVDEIVKRAESKRHES